MSEVRDDQLKKLESLLNELTPERLQAAFSAMSPYPDHVSDDRLPLSASVENVIQGTETLRKVIEGPIIAAIPFGVLRELGQHLQILAKVMGEMAHGNDRRQQFIEQAEGLEACLWKNQLLRTKSRRFELEAQLAHVDAYRAQLFGIIKLQQESQKRLTLLEQESERAVQAFSRYTQRADEVLDEIVEISQKAQDARERTVAQTKEADLYIAALERTEGSASGLLAEIRSARTEIQEASVIAQELVNAVADHRKGLDEIVDVSASALTKHGHEARTLIEEVQTIRTQADEALGRAVASGLFNAFHARAKSIALGKWLWVVIFVISAIFVAYLTIQSVATPGPIQDAMIRRLLVASPGIAIAIFAAAQYARERRLEEIYEFKGKVAVSLDSYQKLVATAMKAHGDDKLAEQYDAFLIQAIEGIFTAPTPPIGTKEPNSITEMRESVGDLAVKMKDLVAEVAKLKKGS